MKKVLITAHAHPILGEIFLQKGFEVMYMPEISYAELAEKIHDINILVVSTRISIDAALIDKAWELNTIARLGSGMEIIDIDYASKKDIICINSPEGNRNAVAEHTLGMLLGLSKNIIRSDREIHSGKWLRDTNRGVELRGKTIGIVGFGNAGSSFAKLLQCFGVNVLAYDKYRKGFGGGFIQESSFEEICKYSDIISFHVPLTEETRGMAGESFFNSLSKKPIIINTSRGEVLNTAALLQAMDKGIIRGAALDVLENEKIGELDKLQKEQFDLLCENPDILLTPHIAGYSEESFYEMSRVLLEKMGFLN